MREIKFRIKLLEWISEYITECRIREIDNIYGLNKQSTNDLFEKLNSRILKYFEQREDKIKVKEGKDDIKNNRIVPEKEFDKLLEDTIRPNDISSWIEYGEKRGYVDYIVKKKLKEIRDEVVGKHRKYTQDKPANYAYFRGYNKKRKEVIETLNKYIK